jgi:hypothetical protein
MQRFRRQLQRLMVLIVAVVLVTGYPLAASAESGATYDPVTGRWNNGQWYFDSATGQYQSVPVPVTVIPDPPLIEQPPATIAEPGQLPVTDTQPLPVVSDVVTSTDTGVVVDNTITNNQTADAITGDAAVVNNTLAGNATSGNASDASTTLNLINSSVGGESTPGVARFVSNISGDVFGDLYINPMIVGALSLQSAANPVTTHQSDAVLDATTINSIANKINLNATTGTATVAGNTTAGDATSGNANAVANVMNIINSIIGANQSFIGTINIYGNLDGDILIAPDLIPQLLAGNTVPPVGGSVVATITDTQTIANIINLNASTGTASVVGNTLAGQATTGTAQTNIVILNLSGHQVIATNSLLVFVNVLGKWVGVIVDAPAGSTAAALGTGVSKNDVSNQSITASTDNRITNDITINATSGDAAVVGNTTAGNATTGNATASANILNMTQSSFGLGGWFGVLFINVFGSWFGSFGVDTSNGNTDTIAAVPPRPSSGIPQVFSFVPKQSPRVSSVAAISQTTSTPSSYATTPTTVAASTPLPSVAVSAPVVPVSSPTTNPIIVMAIIAAVIGIVGVAIRGGWSAIIYRIRGVVSSH